VLLLTKLPEGYALIHRHVVDSTMAEARRLAPGLTDPTWVVADQQTAAHGRRGKPWASLSDNFSGTLLMRPNCPPANAAQRSFVAAIALFDTLAELVGPETLGLKWPNDVLLNDRKVAGILLESSSQGGNVDWLAVGIGVNLTQAPSLNDLDERAVPPISVTEAGGPRLSAAEFLEILAKYFAHWEQQLLTLGFDPIREVWLRHAARLGQTITARTGSDVVTGTFETVDAQGNLVMNTPDGPRAIAAADVYF
jgi:BirA family biotin operon repressor/biotin-[acetyl-CoA-carboxylase] ligase